MKQQLIIIATVSNSRGHWYYNADKNRFDDSENYSISDNPEHYSITDDEALMELYTKEFDGMPNIKFEVYNTETNDFIN